MSFSATHPSALAHPDIAITIATTSTAINNLCFASSNTSGGQVESRRPPDQNRCRRLSDLFAQPLQFGKLKFEANCGGLGRKLHIGDGYEAPLKRTH
jgi:hypothetical protein